jgi:hypothetical protein
MKKVPIRSSNFNEEIQFGNENRDDFTLPDENEPRAKTIDSDELSNLLSDAMNLFYHHEYRTLKDVANRILMYDYRNIRGCLYKSFSEFFDQFDQYEFEVVKRWNEVAKPVVENQEIIITEEDVFNDPTNFDFINDANRYLEYVESLEELSKELHQLSEITELLREEELIQELIIERIVFLDQRISVTISQKEEIARLPVSKVTFTSLKRLYIDKYEEIIAKRDQMLNLSEKEFNYVKLE